MAKTYKVNAPIRLFNRLLGGVIRRGLSPRGIVLLTVRGRKTGTLYSTPVAPVEYGGARYLVAPYGEINWVRNARANGEVMLTQRGKSETLGIQEIDAQTSAPILKIYLGREFIVRPYFDVTPDAPIEAFVAEAPRHPVFRLVPKPA